MKSTLGTLGQDAWASFRPIFNQITDQVVSKEGYEIAREGLGSTLGSLLLLNEDKSSKEDQPNSEEPKIAHERGIPCFPVVDRRKVKKRLVPRGSPSRKYPNK